MNAIEVNHMSKHFNDFSLQDICFSLPKGYIMGYVGQNGAGKTTSINLITGLYKLTEGSVLVDGISIKEDPAAVKESIGYIGDESYYYPEFRIRDVRGIMKIFYKDFDSRHFDDCIKRWKLPENKKIGDFSRGMKIKLMFAGVLSRSTKVLLLDEATSGLDPVTREEIMEILQNYIEDGEHSVLFSTHIMEDLEQIADYIFYIEKGKKVFCDAKDDLLENYVVVKGGREDAERVKKKAVIGFSESEFGFFGVLPVDEAAGLPKEVLVEKATVNQIIVAFQKDANRRKAGMA